MIYFLHRLQLSAMVLSEELVNHPHGELVGMSAVEIMRARENAMRRREADVEREKEEKKEKKRKKREEEEKEGRGGGGRGEGSESQEGGVESHEEL